MEIQQVRALHAISRHGSFGKAAKAMARTQPAITLAIQALERELGTPLMERVGRGSRLTAAGKSLVEATAQFLTGPGNGCPTSSVGCRGAGRARGRQSHGRPLPVAHALRVFYLGQSGCVRRDHSAVSGRRLGHAPPGRDRLRGPVARSAAAGSDLRSDSRSSNVSSFPRSGSVLRTHRPDDVGHERPSDSSCPAGTPGSGRLLEHRLEESGVPLNIAVEAGNWEALKRYVSMGVLASRSFPACASNPTTTPT